MCSLDCLSAMIRTVCPPCRTLSELSSLFLVMIPFRRAINTSARYSSNARTFAMQYVACLWPGQVIRTARERHRFVAHWQNRTNLRAQTAQGWPLGSQRKLVYGSTATANGTRHLYVLTDVSFSSQKVTVGVFRLSQPCSSSISVGVPGFA